MFREPVAPIDPRARKYSVMPGEDPSKIKAKKASGKGSIDVHEEAQESLQRAADRAFAERAGLLENKRPEDIEQEFINSGEAQMKAHAEEEIKGMAYKIDLMVEAVERDWDPIKSHIKWLELDGLEGQLTDYEGYGNEGAFGDIPKLKARIEKVKNHIKDRFPDIKFSKLAA